MLWHFWPISFEHHRTGSILILWLPIGKQLLDSHKLSWYSIENQLWQKWFQSSSYKINLRNNSKKKKHRIVFLIVQLIIKFRRFPLREWYSRLRFQFILINAMFQLLLKLHLIQPRLGWLVTDQSITDHFCILMFIDLQFPIAYSTESDMHNQIENILH